MPVFDIWYQFKKQYFSEIQLISEVVPYREKKVVGFYYFLNHTKIEMSYKSSNSSYQGFSTTDPAIFITLVSAEVSDNWYRPISRKYWNLSHDTQPQQQPHGVLPSVPCCASCPRWRECVQSWAYWWCVDVWVPFQSRGVKSFYYKRSLKTLHLTYLGMLHMLYYMKEKNCKLLLLWHIMLE